MQTKIGKVLERSGLLAPGLFRSWSDAEMLWGCGSSLSSRAGARRVRYGTAGKKRSGKDPHLYGIRSKFGLSSR